MLGMGGTREWRVALSSRIDCKDPSGQALIGLMISALGKDMSLAQD